MAWTEITGVRYRADGLRYASDITDEEWALSAALLAPSHAEQIECFLLKLRRPCHDGEGIIRRDFGGDGVTRQGREICEQCLEAVHWQAVLGLTGRLLDDSGG
jgi:hypothetical protein